MSTVEGQRTTTNGPAISVPQSTEAGYDYAAEKGAGWLFFAALMLGLAGTLGVIDGIVAISKSSFYVAGAHYVFSDLNTWGWIIMIVGAVAVLSAFGVAKGSQWARWFGIVIAGGQAVAQLLMIQAYPFWSLCIFAIDLLVIYALATYGGSRTRVEL
jgi:hypothetical protein